jgi:hypothetical protein
MIISLQGYNNILKSSLEGKCPENAGDSAIYKALIYLASLCQNSLESVKG